MTAQDLVLVLGAYSAFVLAFFGLLIKLLLDTRKTGNETNRAVNNRPDDSPTLRDLVGRIDTNLLDLRVEGNHRHAENLGNFSKLNDRVGVVEKDLKAHMKAVERERPEAP